MTLEPGLYEQLINQLMLEELSSIEGHGFEVERREVDTSESHGVLSRYLQKSLSLALRGVRGEDPLKGQVDLVNRILSVLSEETGDPSFESLCLPLDPKLLLLSIMKKIPLLEKDPPRRRPRPLTGLVESTLFTGSRTEPSLASELQKEIRSADRIDLLMSFIRWSGLRILLGDLEEMTRRSGTKVRILTTTYMGVTEIGCLDVLSRLPNTEIRVSLDQRHTRLHAKAYLFERKTGFSTAYIGSSNLSNPAMTSGLEWNLKVSSEDSPDILAKFQGTFETYWNENNDFVPYLDYRDSVVESLSRGTSNWGVPSVFAGVDLKPFPFQSEILEKLETERKVHGSSRNLVVAATGTGKTVIAAFDFKQFRELHPESTFLFVAHRKEILEQSLSLFRLVLGERNFGELHVGSYRPTQVNHLFLSIQTFHSGGIRDLIPSEWFDYIVVDEIHHAEAATYRSFLEHFRPKILLGLTATPERQDGLDILKHFDGRIAAEIRLPEAINRNLLCPFQYFGVSDDVDYRSLRWEKGGYSRQDLENLLTGNDIRASRIVKAIREYFPDPSGIRGLGFCISVRHAQEMSRICNQAGIPSEALSGETRREIRETVQSRLKKGEIRFVFVVDLYNEGVDLPEINTILFLRPTESLTVFLQQLGRGLRHHEGKDFLTVLDFIGHAHQRFNFEARFRALMGSVRGRVTEEVEEGFPHLPGGCLIKLEKVAQEHVLENIRQTLGSRRNLWVERIRSFESEMGKPLSLASFLDAYDIPLSWVYRKSGKAYSGWTRLLVEAGACPDFRDPDESALSWGLARLSHVRSGRYWEFLVSLASDEEASFLGLAKEENRRFLLMAHYSLWKRSPQEMGFGSLSDSVRKLWGNPRMRQELGEVLAYNNQTLPFRVRPLVMPYSCPLDLHAEYTRDEILAAFGLMTEDHRTEFREGVKYLPDLKTDLLFVTLNKSEKAYSPTTLYDDYALSETLFHWQSQSTTSEKSNTGQRYIHQAKNGNVILLFVREDEKPTRSPLNLSAPYFFLGPVRYHSHRGSRPMSILWELDHPMPVHLARESAKLAIRF
ncbi:MAG: DEAD/DEAH box helicase [Leptospirales bacterium]